MDAAALVDLLLTANRLKTTPRTGWLQRGVATPESVADHTHGATVLALALCDLVDVPVDRGAVLAMAVLHDLPEAVTGDLPQDAARLLPPGAKRDAEARALDGLVAGQAALGGWRDLWDRYAAQECPEARIVKDADRLDLLLQALVYERATGNRDLGAFWDGAPPESFHFPVSRDLAAALVARRALA